MDCNTCRSWQRSSTFVRVLESSTPPTPWDAGPLQRPDLAFLGADLPALGVISIRTQSSFTACSNRPEIAELPDQLGVAKSPLDGSPVRENATAPAWPGFTYASRRYAKVCIYRNSNAC